jgi:hypothetical protein
LQSIHSNVVRAPLSNAAAATNFPSAEGGRDDAEGDGSLNFWQSSKRSPRVKWRTLARFLLGHSEHHLSPSSKPGTEQTGGNVKDTTAEPALKWRMEMVLRPSL